MSDNELEKAIAEFVGAFEVVFRDDWQYTKEMIGDEANGANFIEPDLEDETEDWGARRIAGKIPSVGGCDEGARH